MKVLPPPGIKPVLKRAIVVPGAAVPAVGVKAQNQTQTTNSPNQPSNATAATPMKQQAPPPTATNQVKQGQPANSQPQEATGKMQLNQPRRALPPVGT